MGSASDSIVDEMNENTDTEAVIKVHLLDNTRKLFRVNIDVTFADLDKMMASKMGVFLSSQELFRVVYLKAGYGECLQGEKNVMRTVCV